MTGRETMDEDEWNFDINKRLEGDMGDREYERSKESETHVHGKQDNTINQKDYNKDDECSGREKNW
jgi:hypothetical protein